MMKFCTKCQLWTNRESNVCSRCGAPLKETDISDDAWGTMTDSEKQEHTKRYAPRSMRAGRVRYKGKESSGWYDFVNICCFITVAICAIVGGSVVEEQLIGVVVGFVVGFCCVAVTKLFLAMYGNIETMAENTKLILEHMDEILDEINRRD